MRLEIEFENQDGRHLLEQILAAVGEPAGAG
jgi:hypothetical protein